MEALAPPTVGIAGLGPWGSNLARNFNELARLAWACDADETKLAGAAARYPAARATMRFEDLLEDDSLDAVVVATPVPTHADLARRALAVGKHVFVEKPMALGADDAEELVALAEERGLVLMPGHLLLYHPGVAKLKELVDSGELGEILYVYGNRVNLGTIRRDENALWSLGVHDLSVILHLLDAEPVDVAARGSAFLQGTVEDVVFLHLRFPNGRMDHVHVSWLDP
ncbi:MAG TPA: Gfo/Idh/MocA family oxidoreductase, partial [Gaiellaceae bacterium]|nr:Gfo/Idh/MocA family oxidoreductase [Gaiellaceae bacterium]